METDYAQIAGKYDRTRARRAIGADPVLAANVEVHGSGEYRALDLGCGTGNYLLAQVESGPASVRWDGLDPSPDMLEVARRKLAGRAVLTSGTAETLPYEDRAFHFIMVRAVFHHFPDKEGALDEICRVLRPGGCLHIRNAAYEYRRGYWVYRYFPETWPIDQRRFWPVDRLFRELEARGMKTDGTVTFRRHHQAKSELLLWARNRDLSQLALLSDEAYEAGMSRLSAELAEDVPTETAILDLTALRGE